MTTPLRSNNDEDHIDGQECPCGPKRVHVTLTGTEVWAHRDVDGNYPPADVLLWAIGVTAERDANADA